jgi:hypothetical protein
MTSSVFTQAASKFARLAQKFFHFGLPSGLAAAGMLLTISQAKAVECVNPPAGLVAWWPGEGDASDALGNHPGILHGGISFSRAKVQSGFDFDGMTGYLEVPDGPDLNPAGSFTIEGWIFPRSDGMQVLMQKWVDAGNQRCYSFYTEPNRVLAFAIADDAKQWNVSFQHFTTGSNAFPLNVWSHVAAVYDQSTGTRKIYVNGLEAAGRTDEPITLTASSANVGIGGGFNQGFPNAFFNGILDEISFYSRALTAGEISDIYLSASAGKCGGPIILEQPGSQVAFAGQTITFKVVASGAPPLMYQWSRNLEPIEGATTRVLVLENIESASAGTYSVRIENPFGSKLSQDAVLTVNPIGVSLLFYAGLTISGNPGSTYGIQFCTNLNASSSWEGLTNITLEAKSQLWIDVQSPGIGRRFYRVVPGPIAVP